MFNINRATKQQLTFDYTGCLAIGFLISWSTKIKTHNWVGVIPNIYPKGTTRVFFIAHIIEIQSILTKITTI